MNRREFLEVVVKAGIALTVPQAAAQTNNKEGNTIINAFKLDRYGSSAPRLRGLSCTLISPG